MRLFNFIRYKKVERLNNGDYFYTLLNGGKGFGTLSDDAKLRLMLNNPALAKVVFFNCDVFSSLKIRRKDGKDDELTKRLNDPNYFQSTKQFFWTYRFWMMFGNAYLKPASTKIDGNYQQLYWLETTKIDWNQLSNKLDKLILSQKSYNEILNASIKYKYNDGTSIPIQLKEIVSFQDSTNGLGNWYKGASRIDPLWKILVNSESALDAKNINLEFAGKFLVSGSYDPTKDLNSFGNMQDVEKEDIQSKLRSKEPVHPIKAQIDIKRFVENIANLKLDDSYNEDLGKVGNMFGIPSEILDALKKGSTYENQEKATARHIVYSESPKAQDLLEGLCGYFQFNPDDYECIFKDNTFLQVFKKDEAIVNMTNARTLELLIKNGADPNEAAELLGINLKFKAKQNEE